MNKIIIALVLLITLFFLFNLEENIIILSSAIILLFLTSLFNKNTYEKFTTQASVTTCTNTNTNIPIDGKTISIEAFNNIIEELKKLR
jgi:hypothetical protein